MDQDRRRNTGRCNQMDLWSFIIWAVIDGRFRVRLGRRYFGLVMGIAVLAGVFAACQFSAPAPVSSGTPGGGLRRPGESPGGFDALVVQLGDESFAKRDEAQQALARLPLTWRVELERRLEAARDPEVRSRLQTVIDCMDVEGALNQPPISLEFEDLKLDPMVETLHSALGANIRRNWVNMAGYTYSLKANKLSFIDVLNQLNAQHPLSISYERTGGFLEINDGGITGPGAPDEVYVPVGRDLAGIGIRARRMLFNPDAPPPASLTIEGGLLMDPRVPVIAVGVPMVDAATDDTGNTYSIPPRTPRETILFDGVRHDFSMVQQLPVPEKNPRLLKVKGGVPVRLLIQESHLDIAVEADKTLTATVAGHAFQISFGPERGLHQHDVKVREVVSGEAPAELVVFSLRKSGEVVYREHAGRDGFTTETDAEGWPLKLRIAVPTRVLETTIRFEVANVPVIYQKTLRGALGHIQQWNVVTVPAP